MEEKNVVLKGTAESIKACSDISISLGLPRFSVLAVVIYGS
jgi:hypothetical protein